jgi:hypothetical protein
MGERALKRDGLPVVIGTPTMECSEEVHSAPMVAVNVELRHLHLRNVQLRTFLLPKAVPPSRPVECAGELLCSSDLSPSGAFTCAGVAELGTFAGVGESRVSLPIADVARDAVGVCTIHKSIAIVVDFIRTLGEVSIPLVACAAGSEERKYDEQGESHGANGLEEMVKE